MNPERINPDLSAAARQGDGADDCAQRLSALLDGELDAQACGALLERLRDEAAARP